VKFATIVFFLRSVIIYTIIQYIYSEDSNRLFVPIKKGQHDISSKSAVLSCSGTTLTYNIVAMPTTEPYKLDMKPCFSVAGCNCPEMDVRMFCGTNQKGIKSFSS
jgi:hypothetical protein